MCKKVLIVAVRESDFKTIQNMTALSPEHLYCGLGLHPLYIKEHQEHDLEILDVALSVRNQNCTAVAEIGLERAIPDLLTDELWAKNQQHFFRKSALFSEEIQSVGQFT